MYMIHSNRVQFSHARHELHAFRVTRMQFLHSKRFECTRFEYMRESHAFSSHTFLRSKRVQFSHVRVISDSRNVQKRATESDTSGHCLQHTVTVCLELSPPVGPRYASPSLKLQILSRRTLAITPKLRCRAAAIALRTAAGPQLKMGSWSARRTRITFRRLRTSATSARQSHASAAVSYLASLKIGTGAATTTPKATETSQVLS